MDWSARLRLITNLKPNMNAKNVKVTFILISLTLITGVILHRINERSNSFQAGEKIFLRLKRNTGPVIRGFQYNRYSVGKKALKIKAAKLSIEKKKIGIFKLSPFKIVRFRDAEIDFFGRTNKLVEETSPPRKALSGSKNKARRHDIAFMGVLSPEMMPPAALKGTVSAVCEPVKINLYLDDEPVTKIQANKAIIDPRRRRMILRGNISVASGYSHLSTNRLEIYPETGLFEINNKYVFETQGETITGEKLTTDFFLETVRIQ
jgi:hypothetical protein